MNINSSILFLCILHKFDDFIEAAFDVFSDVVLQMERQVLDAVLLVVVVTVVSCTVYHMSDAVFFKLLVIFGHDVGSKVKELI